MGKQAGKQRRTGRGANGARTALGMAAACSALFALIALAVFAPGLVGAPGAGGFEPPNPSETVLDAVGDRAGGGSIAGTRQTASAASNLDAANGSAAAFDPADLPSVAEIPEEDLTSIAVDHDQSTVLVQVDANCPLDQLNAALSRADGVHATVVDASDLELGFVELQVADGVTPEQAIAQLELAPGVQYAQPNYLYQVESTEVADEETALAEDAIASGRAAGTAAETGIPLNAPDALRDETITLHAAADSSENGTAAAAGGTAAGTAAAAGGAAAGVAGAMGMTGGTAAAAGGTAAGTAAASGGTAAGGTAAGTAGVPDTTADGAAASATAAGGTTADATGTAATDPSGGTAGTPPAVSIELQATTSSGQAISGTTGKTLSTQAASLNDPETARQWALKSVNAYDAWSTTKTQRSVTVAVLDTGCLVTHEDLKANITTTYNSTTGGTDVTPFNGNGHGTHVCGIIAAEANNGKGVAGVSHNARLLPIQIFNNAGATSANIARAYDYVIKNKSTYNIRVVNMSIGIAEPNLKSTDGAPLASEDRLMMQSVEDAYNAGILTVCSAGNDADICGGAYVNYPGDWLDCALSVISLVEGVPDGTAPTRAAKSNYNMNGQKTKDISAPGGSIYSTFNRSSNDYATLSGTSMASPCVAGVAALVFATNPGLSAAQASNILRTTATDLGRPGWDNEYGHGEVNAAAAVAKAKSLTTSSAGMNLNIGAATVSVANMAYTGTACKPKPTVKMGAVTLTEGTHYTLSYKNNTNVGTGTVVVTGKGIYAGSSKSATFKIQPAISSVTLKATTAAYDGKAHKPVVTAVKAAGGSSTAVPLATGCTISYLRNGKTTTDFTSAGTITVKVTGKGTFTGFKTATFRINPASVWKAKVELKQASYVYTGNPIYGMVKSVTLDGKTLKAGTDYAVTHANNKAVGRATVTITGKGNYSSKTTATVKIVPKATWISSLKAVPGGFTATWNKQATQTTGYVIQYATDAKFTKGVGYVVVGKNTTTSAKKTGLKGGTTYYVRVCAYKTYDGGKTKYQSAWSAAKTVKAGAIASKA